MGDDCAVLPISPVPTNLVTSDSLVYGKHFDDAVPADGAGAKLLNRSLSDIASMGGKPTGAIVNLLLPPNVTLDWLRGFYSGLAAAANKWSVPILGGDLSSTNGLLGASVTVWGTSAKPITRKGASPGDAILVTGSLGGSRRGNHYLFSPRIEEGCWLAEQPCVHSMIDLSDGIGKDLPELVPPGCTAALWCDRLPASEDAVILATVSGRTVQDHILDDGEDFELLFTIDGSDSTDLFTESWRRRFTCELTEIGTITEYEGSAGEHIVTDARTGCPIGTDSGYEHLRKT
jgi:thiamine-monophosphate kinase